ncbi:4-(cytidine 5'-diphospho)-2-C-methyl-D-erythritol kinase [Humitalea sp. 24SJ18S-53]|uniref:4-(cytidine 5'-diphospho)-2-C-methyl-D-erythritol kinase n=1 Tax=Humitalea sp. 24SJ18S-53 TaxID=3422307 RepID=UPI003D675EA2
MTGLAEAAPAKVNLFLHVLGRRADGLHLLDSLVVFAGIGDWVALDDGPGLALDGPEAAGLVAEPDNLVLRAARGMGFSGGLRLTKNLPIASGIGGGSADAAATLRLVARTTCAAVPPGLAARLGADVPVCVDSVPARFGGIGDILAAAPSLPRFGLVLANPRVTLATPEVFAARIGAFSAPATLPESWPDAAAMAAGLAATSNGLQAAAIACRPVIADVLAALERLPGCLLARMSGSGATCFGVFADPAAARDAAGLLPKNWWSWGGGLHEAGRAG